MPVVSVDATRTVCSLGKGVGLTVEFRDACVRHEGSLFGWSDEDRLADINDARRDPGIRAIFATTGGKGAYRMIVRPIPLRSTRSSAS
jgi:muramoyltetrapeptide carboxypeptidase LdcA involved in peptidoglycan recycling